MEGFAILVFLVIITALLLYLSGKNKDGGDIEIQTSAPTERAINQYVERLKKKGFSDEDIEVEMLIDPDSPVVKLSSSISLSMTGRKYVPPTRKELIADLERSKNEKELLWKTVSSPKGWAKKAQEYLGSEDWDKFGKPGTGPCPDCESRAGRIETEAYWGSIGWPGSGWSVCRNDCRCELILTEGA